MPQNGQIMQYLWPTLSDNWSLKPFIGHFQSGRFTRVLLSSKIIFVISVSNMDVVGTQEPSQWAEFIEDQSVCLTFYIWK